MKRSPIYLTAALTCLSLYASAAQGGVIAMPPPGPARVANADAVIVGKVESIEPADIKVGNTNYRIAVVKISDGLRGIKGEKSLRVGFIPVEKPANPMIRVSGARPVQLTAGQEGLFILKKQEKETFYTIGGVIGYYINSENNPSFEKEVQLVKTVTKVMENPLASLKAKDADERLLAAAILIEKHRAFRPNSKQEPIDAQESKLIMQALADADWKTQSNFTSLRPAPNQLFQRLGVTRKDGFDPVLGTGYQAGVQAWLRDNAEKYRIQRYVAGDTK